MSCLAASRQLSRVKRYESHARLVDLQHCRDQLGAVVQFQINPACFPGLSQYLYRPAQEAYTLRLAIPLHGKAEPLIPLTIGDQHAFPSFRRHLRATATKTEQFLFWEKFPPTPSSYVLSRDLPRA
jgi:hypothetical protein